MSQHIGPRTISAIGGSIKRVGNYRIHTFPSELVTDGLVLNLDAGDPRSYPSSGTTWTDLSGNANTGTLTNGPTYDNVNGGSIVFDGSDDVITTNTGILQPSTNEITLEQWIKYDSTNPALGSVFGYGVAATTPPNYTFVIHAQSNGFYAFVSNGSSTGGSQSTSGVLSNGSWYHLVWILSPTNIKVYNNGSLVSTASVGFTSLNIKDTFYAAIGKDIRYATGTSERHFKGNVSITRMYNRALSATEIAQNYDALRVRYGSYTNTFTPLCGGGEGKVEVLCVAGGGGGGKNHGGGGGGAGGLVYNSAFSVNSNSAISLSIGAGGQERNNGSNTTFSSLTSIGGGAGATEGGSNGNSGGSGGGGSGFATPTNGGSGTSGQGFAGGRGAYPDTGSTYGHGGGGGGAGSAGTDGTEGNGFTTGTAGNGGNGLSYSISGISQFYAGGGGGGFWGTINGGGLGGSGIGGRGGENGIGANTRHGGNATPNTGSGGGGSPGLPDANNNRIGGNGSNGTVIVRYPATDYNVEVLVVGGGGGGGQDTGGAGGAGGLIYHSSYPVSSGKKLQVTVGKGGPRAAGNSLNATSGGNSIFSNQVAFGGGYGSSNTSLSPGGNGGSGGGGGAYSQYQGVGGTGVSGQGNNGGDAAIGAGGGGGGAGQSGFGGDGTTNGDSASDGGDGLTYSITGSSVVYAAGGGGGQNTSDNRGTGGSSGVGGDGGTSTRNPTDPDVNTGSGGGGGSSTDQPNGVRRGTSGADGIVIIAYKGPQRGIGGTIDTTSRPGYTLHRFTTTGTDIFIP